MASRKARLWEGPEYVAMGSVYDLVHSGGVPRWEREAAAAAVRSTRKIWLVRLENMQQNLQEHTAEEPNALMDGAYLIGEIARLRRLLGIKPSPELVREQTRERVRAYRQRQKAAP